MFFIYNLTVYVILHFIFFQFHYSEGKKSESSHLMDKNAGAMTHRWGVWWVEVRNELTHSVCPWSCFEPCWVWLALLLMFCHFDSMEGEGEDPDVFPKDISPVTNFHLLIPPPMIPLHPNSWTSKQHMSRQKDFIMYMYMWLNIKILTIFLKPIQEYYQ